MACVQKKSRRTMEDIQELLPGFPDHVTMFSIAPKLRWETCNVLQMVRKRWQRAISSRGVYDAKVRSNSTEPFLVLLSRSPDYKIVTSLYSCKDGSCWQLPPISVSNADSFDCICLAGRVFVWVTTRLVMGTKYGIACWTLDLVGHRKWAQQPWVEDSRAAPGAVFNRGYVVLEEKIYRFPGHVNFLKSPGPTYLHMDMGNKMLLLPELEVYDQRRNVWSFITPEPFQLPLKIVTANAKEKDLERRYEALYQWAAWAAEQQAAGPSKPFLTNGVYEPYMSGRRPWPSMGCFTALATDNNCDHAMATPRATQIFHTRAAVVQGVHLAESLCFCGSKSIKLMKWLRPSHWAKIELYDAQENEWKHWKFLSAKLQAKDGVIYDWLGSDCASADNALWATVLKRSAGGIWTGSLLRRPDSLLFDEKSDEVFEWIETGFGENFQNQHAGCIKLRPIHI